MNRENKLNKPKTDDEYKVAMLLRICGYEDYKFKKLGVDERCISIGFREKIANRHLERINSNEFNGNIKLEEVDFEDDDCGTGYFYIIHNK